MPNLSLQKTLAGMQGAEQNINELMGTPTLNYNRRRQAAIDEELFDRSGRPAMRGTQSPANVPDGEVHGRVMR